MSRSEDLLRPILDHPDDDGPRLVYADWLDEQGDAARAEFIRAQIQMEREVCGSRRYMAVWRRTRKLLSRHGVEWFRELPPWVRPRNVEFRRGFIHGVRCTALQFIRRGEQLLSVASLHNLQLDRVVGRLAQLAQAPHLGRIACLRLRGSFDGAELAALGTSPYLSRLTAFRLFHRDIPVDGARGLAATESLTNLTELELPSCNLRSEGFQALARAPWLARLTTLHLGRNDCQVEGLRALLASPYLPRPTILRLGGNTIRNEGVRLLSQSSILDTVRELNLRFNSLTLLGIRALAASTGLAGVTQLDLEGNPIGDAGAHALLASPYLGRLRLLNLRNCQIQSSQQALKKRFKRRFGSRVLL